MSEMRFPLVQRYEFFYSSFLIHKVFLFFLFSTHLSYIANVYEKYKESDNNNDSN